MLREEDREEGVATGKVEEHEAAAHDKRNWVRLTYECNDKCIFCLDSDTHDGEIRSPEEVKAQILDGRRKGATRLILSGGEPTIHPNYVDFIKLGRMAGYQKVQTVTNGRMFKYREFITRCIDAGLGEITFSIHGPNARIHDALVGVKGAFEEEVEGLDNALADGRVIVNIDVCVNRGNVKVLPELIETFVAKGVREYDLLQVIPFGRAYRDGRDILFYDLEEAAPHLRKAFAWSRKPDMHIWLNRFPPEHCEGFEDLIQDPYKLNDEVRGRKEEYERLLTRGVALDCREPQRCRYCYMERLCDDLDEVRDTVADERFERVRVDTDWEGKQGPIYGGDPASARRSKKEAEERAAAETESNDEDGRRRLPLIAEARPLPIKDPAERARRAGAKTLWVVAPELDAARQIAGEYEMPELALELVDYDGLAHALDREGKLDGKRLAQCVVAESAPAEALLSIDATFEVVILLNETTVAWLSGLHRLPPRLALRQPSYERLTEAKERDADLRTFFTELGDTEVPVEDVPACILGREPRKNPQTLDTTMMTPDGGLEIFRYAKRFILDRYFVKSLRCGDCRHTESCRGLHINYVRAHGFSAMEPVPGTETEAAE